MTDWTPVRHGPLPAGEYSATCLGARAADSRAGNPMVVWTFLVEDRKIDHWTLRRGSGAAELHEAVTALGLNQPVRLSEAASRLCRVVLEIEGPYNRVVRVKALSDNAPGGG